MKRCEAFIDAMAADVAGEIDPAAREELLAHLRDCVACADQAGRLREALGGLRDEAVPDPGPVYWASFNRRLRERISVSRRGETRRVWLLAAAAIVVVAAVGVAAALRRPGASSAPEAGGSPPAVAEARVPGGPSADVDQQAEARFEEALRVIRSGKAAGAETDLEALLEEIAPGDPFALAGGWDDDSGGTSGGTSGGSGV